MIPVEIINLSYHHSIKGYAIELKEINNKKRKLSIVVGPFEAQSIALAMENISSPRPLTHDLIVNLILKIDQHIKSVVINDLKDGAFYGLIKIRLDNSRDIEIDCRPSDAIAIALRADSPIFVDENVMSKVKRSDKINFYDEITPKNLNQSRKKILKDKLDEAIESEEYELAADLRDQLLNLKQNN